MIRRHWPAFAIALFALAAGLNLQAQSPAPPTPKAATPPPAVSGDTSLKELVAREQALEKQYKSFTTNLLSLAQKLEKSDRIEDKDKAKSLRKAIDLADKEGVDNKFTTLLRTITASQNISLGELGSAKAQNDELIKVLRQILEILQSDDELARIKEEKKLLEELLANLNAVIRGTKINQARTDSNRGDPKQIGKDQDKVAKAADALANKMGSPKPGGDPKAGEPKAGGKPGMPDDKDQGENKEDAKEPKADERTPGDKADPMKSDGADAKPSKGAPPSSDAKPSKGSPMAGEASAGKPMPMGGDPKDPMKDEKKAPNAEKRAKEDNKGNEKGSAGKPMMPPMDQQASSKSQGSPSDASPSGSPKPGSPSGSPPPGSPPSPPRPKAPGAEEVRKAVQDEENAASNLDQDKRPKASEDLTQAEEKLRIAREELEKRLKQLREQELERLLANLEARVNKMLIWQTEVKAATVGIHEQVQKHPEKKAQPVDFQNAQKQEDREGEIIAEADKAIQLLQSEGSAVAFPAVFEEVRKDMMRVKERLHDANVGDDTQGIETDIIDALTHMRDALKKAQQELGKSPPPPPPGPPSDTPQMQKLLDEIAELKMIRELQKQVNARTKRYGDKTPMAEQTDDGQIKKELRDLGERQEKIETMVNNIATKKNQ
jgi:hypothetical protein